MTARVYMNLPEGTTQNCGMAIYWKTNMDMENPLFADFCLMCFFNPRVFSSWGVRGFCQFFSWHSVTVTLSTWRVDSPRWPVCQSLHSGNSNDNRSIQTPKKSQKNADFDPEVAVGSGCCDRNRWNLRSYRVMIPNVDGLSSKNGHEKQEVPHVRPVLNCSLEQSPHFPQCPAAGPSRGPSRGRGVGSWWELKAFPAREI